MRRRFGSKFNYRRSFHTSKPREDLLRAISAGCEQRALRDHEKPAVYVSKHKFEDFRIEFQLKRNISRKGYVNPTPIQDQSIPYILEGRDIIGIANTGTGKTAAFLVPLIDKIFRDKSQKVLIIAPTRELAVQIGDELRVFANGMGISSVLCIGGANIRRQKTSFSEIQILL